MNTTGVLWCWECDTAWPSHRELVRDDNSNRRAYMDEPNVALDEHDVGFCPACLHDW